MRPRFRHALLLVLPVMLLALPAVATAQEEGEAEPEQISEEVVPISEGGGAPAVEVPAAEEADEGLPWTDRFLIPLVVLLTVLLLGGLVVYYFVRIKNRYRVVSEA